MLWIWWYEHDLFEPPKFTYIRDEDITGKSLARSGVAAFHFNYAV